MQKTNGFARLCRLLARTPLFLNYFRLRNLNKVKNRNNHVAWLLR